MTSISFRSGIAARLGALIVSRVAIAAVLLLVVSAALPAQTTTGRILGTVQDQSGGVLPGATVTITACSAASRALSPPTTRANMLRQT